MSSFSDLIELRETRTSCEALLDRFRRHRTGRVAIRSDEVEWTYAELDAVSAKIRDYLLTRATISYSPWGNPIIAVYAKRSPALVCVLLAIVRSGYGFTILDPSYPGSRLSKCLELIRPVGFINIAAQPLSDLVRSTLADSDECFIVDVPESKSQLLDWNSVERLPCLEDREADLDATFYIAFTSGTTGTPRAVVGSRRPVYHFLEWQEQTFGLKGDERGSMLSGLSHDPLLRDIFMPLWVGGIVCVPSQECYEQPHALFEWLKQSRITVIHLTPSIGNVLLAGVNRKPTSGLPDLRFAFFGGDALRYKTVQQMSSVAPKARIINCYGATETPQVVAYHVIEPKEVSAPARLVAPDSFVPIGKGIDGCQLLVINAAGEVCSEGELGEIRVCSDFLAKYIVEEKEFDREAALFTAAEHVSSIYCTGDQGYTLEDGSVMFTGRNDRQIKLRGYRIDLGEIDSVLTRDASIPGHYLDVQGSSDEEKRIVLYVVAPESGAVLSELRQKLAFSLPRYMIPDQIVAVRSLPLTPNGKVDRLRLQEVSQQPVTSDTQGCSDTISSSVLLQVFRRATSNAAIKITDRIDQLGINSLQALCLCCEIEEAFGVQFSTGELLRCSDVGSLKRDIENRACENPEQQSVPGTRPSSELAQQRAIVYGGAIPTLFPSEENFFVGLRNRFLQLIARVAPDAWRGRLHRARGVTIGQGVSVGYDTIIETSYPWLVRIGDWVNIGMRTTIIGHFRNMVPTLKGNFSVDIREGAFIGPGVIILPNVIIGEGAVVAAGSVVNRSVEPFTFVQGNPATPIATCGVKLTGDTQYEEFIRKLIPIRNRG
ncbi:MAG: AMP-binding protein [Verrucomicrobia bacterium]|nr:AMP-binding protein [Verrucomicrobiota bacterium]